jgi:SAM-dependent methyltransferase
MTFTVPADAYDRYVGRYGAGLAEGLIGAAGVRPGHRALDVGSGPGALARALVDILGTDAVAALDPSETFVSALRNRLPGVDVRLASAEEIPFPDGEFDLALAQLAVNFMSDPELGVSEMRRVVKPGGVVGACVWGYPGEMTLLRTFWETAAELDSVAVASSDERTIMRLARAGELGELWRTVGLRDVRDGALVAEAEYASFDDLWAPFEAGVGPAGAYVTSRDDEQRRELRDEYRRRPGSPAGSFRLTGRAWYATGHK